MTPRQAARAADIFTALVVASVAIALGGLTWRLIGIRSAETPPPVSAAASAAPGADIASALALAPFGRTDPSSARSTSLALVLRGVILAVPSSASTALIAPPGGQPVAYRVGATVPGGATIDQIALDRVLLRVDGRLERLDLPRVSAGGTAPIAGASPAAPLQQPDDSAPPAGQTAADTGSLLDGLGAVPIGGSYRIGIAPSPAARRAGLLPGDVIDRVNGLPATAIANDRQLMASAMAGGTAQVDVLRGGKRISFSFALR